jgi:pheromone shutdown protein TraB
MNKKITSDFGAQVQQIDKFLIQITISRSSMKFKRKETFTMLITLALHVLLRNLSHLT